MASIRSKADFAYRDFVTPALPASGEQEPEKLAIRELFGHVQTLGLSTRAEAAAQQTSADAAVVTVRDFSAASPSQADTDYRVIAAPTVIKPWHWQDAGGNWHEPRGREVHPDSFGTVDPSGAMSSQAALAIAVECGKDTGRPVVMPNSEALKFSGIDVAHKQEIYGRGDRVCKMVLASGSNRSAIKCLYSPTSIYGNTEYLLPHIDGMTIDCNKAGQVQGALNVDTLAGIEFTSDSPGNVNSATLYGFSAKLSNLQILRAFGDGIFLGDNRNVLRLRNVEVRLSGRDSMRILSAGDLNIVEFAGAQAQGAGIQNAGGFRVVISTPELFANTDGYVHGSNAQNVRILNGSIDRNLNDACVVVGWTPGSAPLSGGVLADWSFAIDGTMLALNGDGAGDVLFRIFGDRPVAIRNIGILPGATAPQRMILFEQLGGLSRRMPVLTDTLLVDSNPPWAVQLSNNPQLVVMALGMSASISQRRGPGTFSFESVVAGLQTELVSISPGSFDVLTRMNVTAPSAIVVMNSTDNDANRKKFRIINFKSGSNNQYLLQQLSDDESSSTNIMSFHYNGTNVVPTFYNLRNDATGLTSGQCYRNSTTGALTVV